MRKGMPTRTSRDVGMLRYIVVAFACLLHELCVAIVALSCMDDKVMLM